MWKGKRDRIGREGERSKGRQRGIKTAGWGDEMKGIWRG